jgi:hypothetical protein
MESCILFRNERVFSQTTGNISNMVKFSRRAVPSSCSKEQRSAMLLWPYPVLTFEESEFSSV